MSAENSETEKLRGIVEAVLMTAGQPVSPGKLTSLCKGASGKDLRRVVDELNQLYAEGDHVMTITEVAGGFQFVTRKEFGPWVRKFHDRSQVRVSQAALETLAIIAFKQPVTRIEVDSIRGVDSGGVIRTLLELNMIRIVGRSEGVGRPMLFGTTREFMTHFGLKSLADLPRPKELEELLAEGERKAHAAGPQTLGEGAVDAAVEDETSEEELEDGAGDHDSEGDGASIDDGADDDVSDDAPSNDDSPEETAPTAESEAEVGDGQAAPDDS